MKRYVAGDCAERSQCRAADADDSFLPRVARLLPQVDQGAHEWDEDRWAGAEPEVAHRKRVAEFVHEDQQDEARREQQAEDRPARTTEQRRVDEDAQ